MSKPSPSIPTIRYKLSDNSQDPLILQANYAYLLNCKFVLWTFVFSCFILKKKITTYLFYRHVDCLRQASFTTRCFLRNWFDYLQDFTFYCQNFNTGHLKNPVKHNNQIKPNSLNIMPKPFDSNPSNRLKGNSN